MLDTLRFVVQEGRYKIGDESLFDLSLDSLRYQPLEKSCCSRLILPAELKKYYFPQIFVSKCVVPSLNGRKTTNLNMYIECSVAKLLQGENLFSIREEDLETFANKLSQMLEILQIIVSPEEIVLAVISKSHFSHNMLMDLPVNVVIENIAMVDAWKYDPDTQKDSFRNGGQCYHIHHNAYELVFYDKGKDTERLQYSDKYAIDGPLYPNGSICQKYLNGEDKNILRMEYRLNNATYIKKEVNDILGRPPNVTVTVGDCFNNKLVQQILLKQWQKVEEACFKLPVYRRVSSQLLAEIMCRNPKRYNAHLWKAAYILQMIAEKGRVFVRNMLASMYGKVKAKTMIEDALTLQFTRRQPNYIAQIGQELKKITPLTQEVLSKKVIKSRMKLSMDSIKFLTVKQMANILKVTSTTIYRYLKAGKLTFYKFGKEYRVYEKDFKEFLASCKVVKKGGSK